MEYKILNNGIKMPIMGIGTYLLTPDEAENSVEIALKNGYKLIDTANAYVNEKAVGRGIRKSGIKREEIFLETKLWPSFYEDDNAIEKTLQRLDTDYIDLMILHQPAGNYIEGYKKLEKAYKEGKLKSIGISNFNESEIQEIMDKCEIKPALIQVEAHPYFPRKELNNFLQANDIALQSWYPLGGRGNTTMINEEILTKLAKKYNKTNAQIILRWHTQMVYIVIPGARSEEHIKQNIDIFDFELSDEDIEEIAKLNKNVPFYIRTDEALKRFAELNDDVLFGEVWAREEKLSTKNRCMITIAGLIGKGMLDNSFKYHLMNAKKHGITKEEHGGMFGLGEPNVNYAQYFIGNSYLKPLTEPGKSSIFIANVTFEPRCRNNWHIHHSTKDGGQILICVDGEGWYL